MGVGKMFAVLAKLMVDRFLVQVSEFLEKSFSRDLSPLQLNESCSFMVENSGKSQEIKNVLVEFK